jgi:amino acid permease
VLIIITLAVLVDSVALIWAVIGSFGCISVGFIFPPLAYLKVGCRQQRLKRLWAWLIVCVGAVLLVLCVAQTVFALAT